MSVTAFGSNTPVMFIYHDNYVRNVFHDSQVHHGYQVCQVHHVHPVRLICVPDRPACPIQYVCQMTGKFLERKSVKNVKIQEKFGKSEKALGTLNNHAF